MPNVRKFLDLSTGHLTPLTRQKIDSGEISVRAVYPHPDSLGWLVYVPSTVEEEFQNEEDEGDPEDLRACFAKARALDCDYLLFDADAEYCEGLPSYDDDGNVEAPDEEPLADAAPVSS